MKIDVIGLGNPKGGDGGSELFIINIVGLNKV